MRKEFSAWIEKFSRNESRLIFLTGDLGFGALENVQAVLGPRFINVGVCEQNMVSLAAGLASEGLLPLCYSIAPFAVFRPYEQIRLDVALHRLPVRIVGNGGGYGYGIMGATHHALEDIAVLSALPNFRCVIPLCNSDVAGASDDLFSSPSPGYLRLGFGAWPAALPPLPAFAEVRRIFHARRPVVTVVGMGPVLLNSLRWLGESDRCDVFAVSVLPLASPGEELLESVRQTRVLWVIEEHSSRGGMGEHLSAHLARRGIAHRLHHHHATGYPTGQYGSQQWHQQQSGLDADSLRRYAERNLLASGRP